MRQPRRAATRALGRTQSCAALFPSGDGAGTVAIAECRFHDEAALQAALGAPESPRVMADIANFTDAKPAQSRAGPV